MTLKRSVVAVGALAMSVPLLAWARHVVGTPVAILTVRSVDAGAVPAGAIVKQSFEIRNEGDGALVIERIEPGCGAAIALTGPGTVAPGGRTMLTLSFDTRGAKGRIEVSTVVRTNDDENSAIHLSVAADVYPEVAPSVTSLDLGLLPAATRVERRVELKIWPGSGVEVREAFSTAPDVTVSLRQSPAGPYVDVHVTPTSTEGLLGNVVLSTSSSHARQLRIPIRGTVTPQAVRSHMSSE